MDIVLKKELRIADGTVEKPPPWNRNRCPACWQTHKTRQALTDHIREKHDLRDWREIV